MRKFALVDRVTLEMGRGQHLETWIKGHYHSSLAQRYELFELVPRTIETKTVIVKEIV